MIRHCPKSCNLCHKKYRREKVEVIVETVEEVIDEEGQPIVIVDYCVDKNYVTDCKRRAELGQCNSNFV